MIFRPYEAGKDQQAIQRLWEEVHWIDRDDEADRGFLDSFLSSSRVLVAEVNGSAECLVASAPGNILHLETEQSLAIVASVATSLVARKLGLATRLTARLVAEDAQEGFITSALGMFEQGYYSRLGFGTGPYEHKNTFNPAHLIVPVKAGVPFRLTEKDFAAVHNALMKRWRSHGSVNVFPPEHAHAELGWTDNPCGFGFRDASGELTHFIWGEMKDEYGPYLINALAYRNQEQLLELLALIKSLGDQIYTAKLLEPVHIQLQDLISEPFKGQNTTRGGKYAIVNRAEAFWQLRINDLPGCLANTHLPDRPTLSFNLSLTDPIKAYLDSEQPWQGIAGEYTVHLGPDCQAQIGHSKGLANLQASVGGFSRLWLGCASATAIAMAGEINATQELLDTLEKTLSLPLPRTGWEF